MRNEWSSRPVAGRRWILLLALALLPLGTRPIRAETPPGPAIEIDAGTPGIRMSPKLWGIFFEAINFADDGGIYAELVRNRTFEWRNHPLEGWKPRFEKAKGTVEADPKVRLNDVRTLSLRVAIESVEPGGRFHLVNEGYWGMPLRKGDPYAFSLFAKGDAAFAGARLTVSLQNAAGDKVYASKQLDPLGAGWQSLKCVLAPDATDFDGRLVITADAPGTFWLSLVSLFPPTWKNQPNGLRPDLVEKLVALKPSFFRFPGGCFAEGGTLRDAFRFKETLGPIEERKGRRNFWGYHSSDGLGYYEYLRLSEDLGADPIFCINPGGNNGCGERIPLDKLGPWLQTAVDAIEFAVGPAGSPWGARRAAMGHPQPFRMKTFYLQIGNETEFGRDDYSKRYEMYRKYVKDRYPGDNVQIIADSWGMGYSQDFEGFAIDVHQYSKWDHMIRSRDKHDKAKRGKPFIFEGEYATRGGSGAMQALSEAVYMMGLEENSDEVVLAAYAPLFGNVKGCQWHPDLIYFDNHRSMGTLSYYVQQMYSTNRGDRQLPVRVSQPAKTPAPAGDLRGAVGIGTWTSHAEFKDIVITHPDGKKEAVDLSGPGQLEKWKTLNGEWSIADGVMKQKSHRYDCRAWLKDSNLSDYRLDLKVRKIDGNEGLLILFHVKDQQSFTWLNLGGWGNREHAVERTTKDLRGTTPRVPGRIEDGRWYDVRIAVKGSAVVCWLDGKKLLTADLGTLDSAQLMDDLHASACLDETANEVLVRVVNVGGRPRETTLTIKGAKLGAKGTAITLDAKGFDVSQSLDAPTAIVPRTTAIENVSNRFTYQFPPYSFTILRLKR